ACRLCRRPNQTNLRPAVTSIRFTLLGELLLLMRSGRLFFSLHRRWVLLLQGWHSPWMAVSHSDIDTISACGPVNEVLKPKASNHAAILFGGIRHERLPTT